MKGRLLSICTALCLCLTLLPGAALAAETEGAAPEVATYVPYIGADGAKKFCAEATVVTETTTEWGGDDPNAEYWYVVDGIVNIDTRITVKGDVHLILGGNLYALWGGINVGAGNSLTIYGQEGNSGVLKATNAPLGAADIGGGPREACGTVTICGGEVEVTTGIGGGEDGDGGAVTVTGGIVNAPGGIGGGVGGGTGAVNHGTFTIKGDAVVYAIDGIGNRTGEKDWQGVVFLRQGDEVAGKVYGNVTLPDTVNIRQYYALTIPEGAILTVPEGTGLTLGSGGKFIIEGTLINYGGIWNRGEVTNYGTIKNYGAIKNDLQDETKYPGKTINNGTIENYGTLPSDGDGEWTEGEDSEVLHAAKVAVEVEPNPYILEEEKEKTVTLTATVTYDNDCSVTGGAVTFYRGDEKESTPLDKQAITEANNGTVTCTITDEWEADRSYTFTAVYAPARDGGPPQLGGTGTATLTVQEEVPATVYPIGTAEDLAAFRDRVNNGETNAIATLTADIDLGGETWTPIGSESSPYTGIFDGQGHTIRGLYVNSGEGHAGLFGVVGEGGTVKNLAVKGTVIANRKVGSTPGYTGGVVGENSGTVINCAFSGKVADNSTFDNSSIFAGGVAGYNTGTVQNCYSAGGVTVADTSHNQDGYVAACAGGVVGRNSFGTVTNCYYRTGEASEGYPTAGIGKDDGTAEKVDGKSGDDFTSGAVAYLLNNFTSGENSVWRQNLDNGAVPDTYPVPDPGHGVVYEVEDGEYSNSVDGTWTISGCTVTLSENKDTFIYNGKEQKPTVESVQWGENTFLKEDTHYTVEYPAPSVNADTYKITITGTGTTTDEGSYNGKVEVTYTIKKATLTAAYVSEMIAVGEKPAREVTVDGFVGGETAGSAEDYTAPHVNITSAEPGSYKLTPTGGSATNYDFEYKAGTLTIRAAGTGGDTDPDDPGGDTGNTPGGSGSPTYRPDVEQPEGGEVSVSPRNPHRGDTVTVTPEPEEGYEVDTVTVTDRNGNEVEVTDNGDGTFSFTQPSGKVTIQVTFRETEPEPLPFADVPADHWAHDAIRYVYEHGLMAGTGADVFDPEGTTTRGQIVTILWRLSGSPVVDYLMDFSDVDPSAWYGEAIRWAASEGIAGGYGGGLFGPDDAITREQFVVMLFRYAQHEGLAAVTLEENLTGYADADSVSGYAVQAMNWAVGQGIIGGTSPAALAPQGTATRAQAAAMLTRFCELNK